jgi:hypothetical protein
MYNRRKFIQQTGMLSAGLLLQQSAALQKMLLKVIVRH